MRICVLALATLLLRICGSTAPDPNAVAQPGMPGAVPGLPPLPVAGQPGVPGWPPGVPVPGVPPSGIAGLPGVPLPGVPLPTNIAAPLGVPTVVTGVSEGPHHGSLLTTAQARFEVVATDEGALKVYITDPTGEAISTEQCAMPVFTLVLPEGPRPIVLHPNEGCFEGTIGSRPTGPYSVQFDALVRGVSLTGITASLGAGAAVAATPAAPTPAVPAPAAVPPAPAAPAPPPPAVAAPTPPAEAAPAEEPGRRTKAPRAERRRKRGPQAQTFAPAPLAPSPPSRGVTVQPGAGVQQR